MIHIPLALSHRTTCPSSGDDSGESAQQTSLHPSLQRQNVLPTVGASLDWTVPEVCDAPTHKVCLQHLPFVMLLIWNSLKCDVSAGYCTYRSTYTLYMNTQEESDI